jgi:hypothetical protein
MSSQDVQALRLCDYTGIAITTNSTINANTSKSAALLRISAQDTDGSLLTLSAAFAVAMLITLSH